MSKKLQFCMVITETEREIMDFVVRETENGRYTKTQFVMDHFINYAKGYCGFDGGSDEDWSIAPEILLIKMKEAKLQNDSKIVGVAGVDNYRKLVQTSFDKGNIDEKEVEYQNSVIDLYIKNTSKKKVNEDE